MSKDNGGPAFPLLAEQCIHTESQGIIGTEGYGRHAEYGMSLRDYFAAKAMQSTQSDPAVMIMLGPKPNAEKVAEYAYWVADAMLAERAK